MKTTYTILILFILTLTSCVVQEETILEEPPIVEQNIVEKPPIGESGLACNIDSDCEIRDSCSDPCCGSIKDCYIVDSPIEQCPMYLNFDMDECALMDCMYDAAACRCNQNNNQCESVGEWELK
jgi:hypothetical protein